ncbi:RNA polymerase sigma factor [Dokdonella soli]
MTSAGYAAQIEKLCGEHHRALLAFLQCRLNSLADAQEVAQEAYVRLLTLECPERVGDLRAYLFRTASNLAIDHLRMRQVRDRVAAEADLAEAPTAPPSDRQAIAIEQLHGIREALRELPAKTSRAFVQHVIEGRDFGVIARTMKLSERMTRYHVTRALAHCRARMDEPEMER